MSDIKYIWCPKCGSLHLPQTFCLRASLESDIVQCPECEHTAAFIDWQHEHECVTPGQAKRRQTTLKLTEKEPC